MGKCPQRINIEDSVREVREVFRREYKNKKSYKGEQEDGYYKGH